MPSGKTHDAITFLLAAPTFAAGWGLTGSLMLAACATGPGPAETSYTQANAICAAGGQDACRQAAFLYPQVLAERQQQQAQNNAVATGIGLGIIGLALGAAIAGGGSRHHHGGYGRGGRWRGHRGW